MTRRFRIGTGLLVAGAVGLLVWRASGPGEPVFKDRTLTSWLDHHVASSGASPPYGSPGWKKADEAIRDIGTNAIPTLLEMIRAKDRPPFVLKLMETARRLGLTQRKYRHAMSRHEEAEYAFEMLGTNAVSAVPELIRIYERNVSPSSQMCAALALGHIVREAQAAIPVFQRHFTHTNADVRFYAVSAVMSIGGEPKVVVPLLASALKDADIRVRWNALSGLSRFFAHARPVVPEILKLLNDQAMIGTSRIQEQVETALWRIAPEKVGKPLIVEDSSPIIENGVTTQALKATFLGERETLIRAGRSVPAIAQYWNSDPRPHLTIYRGVEGQDETDNFLGQYEVLDVPDSDDVNISTLCVIADGQIILCARDNNRKQFLKIRRADSDAEK